MRISQAKDDPPGGPAYKPTEMQELCSKQSLWGDKCRFITELLKPSKASQRLKSHIHSKHRLKEMRTEADKLWETRTEAGKQYLPCSVKGCLYIGWEKGDVLAPQGVLHHQVLQLPCPPDVAILLTYCLIYYNSKPMGQEVSRPSQGSEKSLLIG